MGKLLCHGIRGRVQRINQQLGGPKIDVVKGMAFREIEWTKFARFVDSEDAEVKRLG